MKRRCMYGLLPGVLSLVCLLGVAAPRANADILVTFTGTAPEAGQFRWFYDVRVLAGQTIQPFDFFAIYDFDQIVLGTNQQPADWSFSAPFLGPYPPGSTQASTGDQSVPHRNLSWQYVGNTPIVGAGTGTFLGTFSERSLTDIPHQGVFAGSSNAGEHGNQGVTQVPSGQVVPEPSTMTSLAVGSLLLGFWSRRQKKVSNRT
jgi:PEP-CTERM motif